VSEDALAPATPRGIAPSTFDGVWGMAERLATARGFVPVAMEDNPGAIAACILTGLELGLGPMQSLRSIHIIEGKPTLSADLMLAIAIRGGVRATWSATDNERASLRLERDGREPFDYTWTMGDAQTAGLASRQNWRKYPAAMLRARCVSAALRAYCPDVLGAGVYVEGEIEASDPPRVIDVTPQDYDSTTPAPPFTAGKAIARVGSHVAKLYREDRWDDDAGDRAHAKLVELGVNDAAGTLRGWLKDLRHEPRKSDDIDDGDPGVWPADGSLTPEEEARMDEERLAAETAAVESAVSEGAL